METLVKALMSHRNWYLDLANERDLRDDRYVSTARLKKLRETVRKLDPARLVTASFGGHDLSLEEVREALMAVGVDILCPHRPRHFSWLSRSYSCFVYHKVAPFSIESRHPADRQGRIVGYMPEGQPHHYWYLQR